MLTARMKPEEMDEQLAMDYLDELELTARQLERDPEKRQETGELIDRVRNRLAQCLKRRQKVNFRKLCRSNLSQIWQLKKLADAYPSLVLYGPDDILLYWYVHGEFPSDMSSYDMEKTRRRLESRLDQMTCREESDSALVSYRWEKTKGQLRQLQDMIGEEDPCNFEESTYLFYLPNEPENPENLTIPELGLEIERQEYNLLSLNSEGLRETQRPTNWQEAVDSVKASLSLLRELLKQRLLEALGEEPEDPSAPEGFEDGDLPIFCGGDTLGRTEDIVASWYLSDSFPLITSGEKMLQVEAELQRQQAELELNEPEDEAEHGLWGFRWEQRAEQIDQIQTMMFNQEDNWEIEDLEEETEYEK